MNNEYTAEDARVLADRLENGNLYVCSDEVSSEQDDYGYDIHYYQEQWKISYDIVHILREYAKMKEEHVNG